MRIATLNTWKNEGDYWRRLGLMGDALAALAPDMVALQECFFAEAIGADTAGAIASRLGYVLTRADMRMKQRAIEGRDIWSRSDLAILTRAAPKHSMQTALIPDPRDGERLALAVDLDMDGAPLRIVNVHLTHLHDAAGAAVRTRQAADVLAFAQKDWVHPYIIAGDMNDLADSAALSALFTHPHTNGALAVQSLQHLRDSGGAMVSGGAIDHVLLFDPIGACALRRREVGGEGPGLSDHPLIWAEVENVWAEVENR